MILRPQAVIHCFMLAVYAAFLVGRLTHRDDVVRGSLLVGAGFCAAGFLTLVALRLRSFLTPGEEG